jgi:mono/diheme cytochrome c family protein
MSISKKNIGNMKSIVVFALVAGLFLLIAACGGGEGEPTASQQLSAAASEGQRLFTANACSACHGATGQATSIAPGLAGHTAAQVKRQARAPLGLMPVFPPSQISDMELDQIAQYIESLGGDHLHVSLDDPALESAQHHWMTLFALDDEAAAEAVHHIDHISGLVTGQHLSQMNEAKAEVEAGNLHEGPHIIENMLAGTQVNDLTPSEMHAGLARSSALVGDADGALHHLDHISEALSADPVLAGQVAEIRELLESGELGDAAHEAEELVEDAHEEEHDEPEGHGH